MSGRRMGWRIYLLFLFVMAVSLLSVSWYTAHSMRKFYLEQVLIELRARAHFLEYEIARHLKNNDMSAINGLCRELGKKTSTRITVVLPSGEVIGDSDENISMMENHASRPEILEALSGGAGSAVRWSPTLRQNMMYATLPIRENSKILAVLRTAVPLAHVELLLGKIYMHITIGGIVIAAVVLAISLGVYRRIMRSLEDLRAGAERFARGEFTARICISDSEEVGSVAAAMNRMAEQLEYKTGAVIRQQNVQAAILSSMIEGVLAVDMNRQLICINQAASKMLGISPEIQPARTLEEVVRNPELQCFVENALFSDTPVTGNMTLHQTDRERFLRVHGTALRDERGNRIGAALVLSDVTQLRRLENMRKEFVANVSHELKTPITSIKGFVETLLDGALHNKEDAERFLAVVSKHADRLNRIIQDLLLLSQVEQDAEGGGIETDEVHVADVLRDAVDACSAKISEKNISIETICSSSTVVSANMQLLTQAVANLIDNAVKYSEAGGTVRVEAVHKDDAVFISVHDHGCGIPPEHLPRLGERFYRVDRARSRQQGGTGLGLAIVKHIMEAHGGSLLVESTPGKGSSFHLRLPPFSKKS